MPPCGNGFGCARLRPIALLTMAAVLVAAPGCTNSPGGAGRVKGARPPVVYVAPTHSDISAVLRAKRGVIQARLSTAGSIAASEVEVKCLHSSNLLDLDATRLLGGSDIMGSLVPVSYDRQRPQVWTVLLYQAGRYVGSLSVRRAGESWVFERATFDKRIPVLESALGGAPDTVASFGPFVFFVAGVRGDREAAVPLTPDSLMHDPPRIEVEANHPYTTSQLREICRAARR